MSAVLRRVRRFCQRSVVMPRARGLGLGVLASALAIGLAPSGLAAQFGQVPVDMRVPVLPIPVVSRDSARLIYELHITNLARRDLAVREIRVQGDDGTELARWTGDALGQIMGPVGGTPGPDRRVIGAGRRVLAFLYVVTPTAEVPRWLSHHVVASPVDTTVADTLVRFNVEVRRRALPVLQSPFGGGGVWVAVNGPGNTSGHRRTALPIDGRIRIPQRFATDWIKVGDNGIAFQGDSTKNESWAGHGVPILAVAAGTVVAVKDGIIENVPLSPRMAVPITLETVGGNHVILDLGDGFYAFYAHLKPGSVSVKVGDRVRPGQQVGQLGNSGNSTAPHLHLHIGDLDVGYPPTPLGMEGLPFVFDGYRWLGTATELMAAVPPELLAPGAGAARARETPLENDLIRFR